MPHATAPNTIPGLEKPVLWWHGTPESVESANGTHFKEKLISNWAKEHDVEGIYHTPPHTPAPGQRQGSHRGSQRSSSLPAPRHVRSFHPPLASYRQVSQAPRALPSFLRPGRELQAEGLAKLKSGNEIPPVSYIIVCIKYFINAMPHVAKAERVVKKKTNPKPSQSIAPQIF